MGLSLKERKYIKNGLPAYDPGKTADVMAGTAATLQSAGNLAAGISNAKSFNTTTDDYIQKYGTTQMNVNDIGYTKYNDINISREMDLVKAENTRNTINTTLTGIGTGVGAGATIGMIAGEGGGPIGAAIGAGVGALGGLVAGLIGGNSRKHAAERELAAAQDKVNRLSDMNRSYAMTSSLQQDQALKYGNQEGQTLFSYHGGKPAEDANGNVGMQTAWGDKGETMYDTITKNSHIIPHGDNDTARISVKDTDAIFGNTRNPFTGNTFKEDAAPLAVVNEFINKNRPKTQDKTTQRVYEAVTNQARQKAVAGLDRLSEQMKYAFALEGKSYGTMPKLEKGYIDPYYNIASGILGGAAGLSQYLQALNDTPYKPDTYVANPYQNRGLNTLAGLRINPYNTIQQLRNAEARTNYAVNASGGLNTAQKQLFRQSGLSTTQQNIANALQQIQAQNNQYKAAYANAALQYGQNEAQRRQQANQYDLEYYTRSHAARQQGMQMGIRNMLDTFNQYAANEFKRQQGNYMLDLYRQRGKLDKERLNWEMNNSSKTYIPNSVSIPWNNNMFTKNSIFNTPASTFFGVPAMLANPSWRYPIK